MDNHNSSDHRKLQCAVHQCSANKFKASSGINTIKHLHWEPSSSCRCISRWTRAVVSIVYVWWSFSVPSVVLLLVWVKALFSVTSFHISPSGCFLCLNSPHWFFSSPLLLSWFTCYVIIWSCSCVIASQDLDLLAIFRTSVKVLQDFWRFDVFLQNKLHFSSISFYYQTIFRGIFKPHNNNTWNIRS